MTVPANLHPDFLARRDEMLDAYGASDWNRAASIAAGILQDSLAFDAIHICGIALPHLGNFDQGYDFACASLSLCKPRVEWFINCSKAWSDERMFVHAMVFVENGLKEFPDNQTLMYQRGILLTHTLAYEDAIKAFDECLGKYPDFGHAMMSKAFCLHMVGRYDEAIALDTKVESFAEGDLYEDTVNNHYSVLMELGRRDEALWLLEHATRNKERHGTLYNKSYILLGNGVWPEAWHMYRLRQTVLSRHESGLSTLGLPVADTLADICGKHLVLIHEQGLGDSLQFIRYAPILRRYVSKLTIGVPRSMERMAKRLDMDGDYEVICGKDMDADRDHIVHCDVVMPMLDAPAILQQRTDNIPNDPYFLPPPDALVRERSIGDRDGRLRVGLVWAGASRPDHLMAYSIDRRRSLPFTELEPLLRMSDCVQFVSLQLPDQRVDDERVMQPLQEGYDILDTAAVIMQLDLVVTIDSSMCHLSAALGKPTWMLSRFDGCWRWRWPTSETEWHDANTEWYPTMTIFRQRVPGDWLNVIERVRRELADMTGLR